VIVRISNEGQYDIADGDAERLHELDHHAVVACDADDEPAFRAAFDQLLAYIRTKGTPVGDDELVGSEVILPPADVSLAEARTEFHGEGLIPG
jgi:hypothetical protein